MNWNVCTWIWANDKCIHGANRFHLDIFVTYLLNSTASLHVIVAKCSLNVQHNIFVKIVDLVGKLLWEVGCRWNPHWIGPCWTTNKIHEISMLKMCKPNTEQIHSILEILPWGWGPISMPGEPDSGNYIFVVFLEPIWPSSVIYVAITCFSTRSSN